jgi:hypothetical protein
MTGKTIGKCEHFNRYCATIVTDREDPLENPLAVLILLVLKTAYLEHLMKNPECMTESGTDRDALNEEYAKLRSMWERVSVP